MNSTSLTKSQILGLSPDRFVIKNALKELDPGKWSQLGRQGALVWGVYPRSNQSSYTIKIDLNRLAIDCSCSDRKNPCRFSLALLLLFHQSPHLFPKSPIPDWVRVWSDQLDNAAGRPVGAGDERFVERLEHIQEGMAEFSLWLKDILNEGLAKLPQRSKEVIFPMVDRLYDAHAILVANDLKEMGMRYFPRKGEAPDDWPTQVLGQLGRFYILTQAWRAYETLSPAQQTDLSVASGFLNELDFGSDRVVDQWQVVGRRTETVGPQMVRRLWLRGQNSGRYLLLSESHNGRVRSAQNKVTDFVYSGEVGFAPSSNPVLGRFLTAPQIEANTAGQLPPQEPASLLTAQRNYAEKLTQNPWLMHTPLMLNGVYLRRFNERWYVVDSTGQSLPLKPGMRDDWNLLARSQGDKLTLFGEMTLNRFEPISILWDGAWLDLIVWGRTK